MCHINSSMVQPIRSLCKYKYVLCNGEWYSMWSGYDKLPDTSILNTTLVMEANVNVFAVDKFEGTRTCATASMQHCTRMLGILAWPYQSHCI